MMQIYFMRNNDLQCKKEYKIHLIITYRNYFYLSAIKTEMNNQRRVSNDLINISEKETL